MHEEKVVPHADNNNDFNNKIAATNSLDTVAIVIFGYNRKEDGGPFVYWGGIQLFVSNNITSWRYENAEQSRIRLLLSRETRVIELMARVAMTEDNLTVGYY